MSGAVQVVKRAMFIIAAGLLIGLGFSGAASAAGPARAGSTFITSYLTLPAGAIAGGQSGVGGGAPSRSALSSNGRYLAFLSTADTLSAAAHPDVFNIFRKDQTTGSVELVSRASGAGGAAPTLSSLEPRISDDGNLVAFLTTAKLDPGDTDEQLDVYVRNLSTDETTLETPGTTSHVFQYDLSGDGQFIAFASPDVLVGTDLNGQPDVFRRNLTSGTINLVSRIPALETAATGFSSYPSISGDGRWVAFTSDATNITAGFVNQNGGGSDVFVRDMTGSQNYLVSSRFDSPATSGNSGSTEPAIAGTPAASAEVRIAYSSNATNVAAGGVDASNASSVYVRNALGAAPSVLVSRATGGENADSRANTPFISDDANLILFSSDSDNLGAGDDYYGTYLRDVSAATTVLGSARNEYAIGGDISGNGNRIAWTETGGATSDSDPDAYGVFTRSLPGGPVVFASRPKGNKPFLLTGPSVSANYQSSSNSLSADGRYTAIEAYSVRLTGGDNGQVFRRDLKTGKFELVSRKSGASGAKSEGAADPSISNDGSKVAFISYSPLVAADTDDFSDVYLRDLKKKTTVLVSRADGAAGADANSYTSTPAISGDGRRVAFVTDSSNLGVPGGDQQIYVRDVAAAKTIHVSKAAGQAGVAGDAGSSEPSISNNGQVVVFHSFAGNLHPDDVGPISLDVYLRNLSSDALQLVSRLPGLAGAKSPGIHYYSAISGDGTVVVFTGEDEALVPGTGPWPVSTDQLISRVVSTGANSLVSRSADGLVGNGHSGRVSLNRDGSMVAFASFATNLLAGRGGENRQAVIVRNMKTGKLTGPPAFGLKANEPQQGARAPSISDNGRCVAFVADGHSAASGTNGDIQSSYVYVNSGTCTNPRGIPVPKLTAVSVKGGKKTRVSFRLNTRATVTVTFQRKNGRRLVGAGKVVRKNQKAGRKTITKRLKPGRYKVTVSAKSSVGKSRKVRKNFTVRR